MESKFNKTDFGQLLDVIVQDFGKGHFSKEELLVRLVREGQLQPNISFSQQIEQILERPLSANEKFTVDSLYRILHFRNQVDGDVNDYFREDLERKLRNKRI